MIRTSSEPALARSATCLAVASTSAQPSVEAVLRHAVGDEMARRFRVFAGDVVPKKKPAPDIYQLAVRELAVDPDDEKLEFAKHHGATIGVNAYLWRATLDALSFMPMAQTDSNGGVVVTDWYTDPNTPTERMKVTVSILDQDLRADALRGSLAFQAQPSLRNSCLACFIVCEVCGAALVTMRKLCLSGNTRPNTDSLTP